MTGIFPLRALVILESPFAGKGDDKGKRYVDMRKNITYTRRCVRDSIFRNEAPLASHLLYTQPGILRDDVPEERTMGIEVGLAWLPHAYYSVFYTDRGWSEGMLAALQKSLDLHYGFYIRALDTTPIVPVNLPHNEFQRCLTAVQPPEKAK